MYPARIEIDRGRFQFGICVLDVNKSKVIRYFMCHPKEGFNENFRALALLFSEPAGGTIIFFILAPRVRPPRLPPVRGRYHARTGSSPRLSQMEA